MQSLEL